MGMANVTSCYQMPILANAGTPLMLVGAFYMLIGNAIIGLLEGMLLIKLYKTNMARTIALLIAANYLSAWLGLMLINNGMSLLIPVVDINNLGKWIWLSLFATYGMTLLLEFPLVYFALSNKPGRLKNAVVGSLIVQTLSYVLLIVCCLAPASNTSLYRKAHIVEPSAMAMPDDVALYYISDADGNVYRRFLSDNDEEIVYNLDSIHRNDRLYFKPSKGENSGIDLFARLDSDVRGSEKHVLITSLNAQAAVDKASQSTQDKEVPGNWFNFGFAQVLDDADTSGWEFRTGFWPVQGLKAENTISGERVQIAYETMLLRWNARNAYHVPGDIVIFQLGADQVCAFNPQTRQLALIAKGRGPIVANTGEVTKSTPAKYER